MNSRDLAYAVIAILEGRKGFDHWWHDSNDSQEEIIQEIIDLLEKEKHDE